MPNSAWLALPLTQITLLIFFIQLTRTLELRHPPPLSLAVALHGIKTFKVL
jgi:hypothetical protein